MPTALPSLAAPVEEQQFPNKQNSPSRFQHNLQDRKNSQDALKQEPLDSEHMSLALAKAYTGGEPHENQPANLHGLNNSYSAQLQPDILSGMSDMSGLTSKANLVFEGNVQELTLGW